ncbi:Muconate cycloisomerase 1 [Meredithblackwellia eburnea MCA 4105]
MSSLCPAPPVALVEPVSTKIHYLLSGTFNTVFLYLLAFNPLTSDLSIHAKIRGEGPHQFWALNEKRDRAYGTTWAQPPTLSAWEVLGNGRDGIKRINTVPITATSSYIQVSPVQPRIYSAGGPTGEVHAVDPVTGGFGEKLQQMLYVPEADLDKADKTRVALRYGSHGIDINLPRKQVFVPHVGHDSIYMYNLREDGQLDLVNNCPSYGTHDGIRHVVPSADGSKLYGVTEHTSFVDVYDILPDSLQHRQRFSVIPSDKDPLRKTFRGDTLRFSQDGQYLFVTTRGMTSATRGYVSVWKVGADGLLASEEPVDRYETPTSGGKANAVETFPFHPRGSPITTDWIVLTDDQDGWIIILEWDGKKISEKASVRLGVEDGDGETDAVGASHAVWLS